MHDQIVFSFHIFGPGRGESIILVFYTKTKEKSVYIIDTASASPVDSLEKNPVLAFQRDQFTWSQVKGICLTHPHEDHFTGLAAVARQTANAKWMRTIQTPFDSIIKHYDTIEGFRKSKQSIKKWLTEKIRELSDWGEKNNNDFCCTGYKPFPIDSDDYKITFIAPEDTIATDYDRKLNTNIDKELLGEPESSPKNLHNIASAGIVVDLKNGARILLLGDMVEESWARLLYSGIVSDFLNLRKADIIKLPHHCSSGSIFKQLLSSTCNPHKTIALFTPYSYKRHVPDPKKIEEVSQFVKELWATAGPTNDSEQWKCSSSNGILYDLRTEEYLKRSVSITKDPIESRVTVNIARGGKMRVITGQKAYRFK